MTRDRLLDVLAMLCVGIGVGTTWYLVVALRVGA